MATQKRPLPSADRAEAEADRTISGIFDSDYQATAFNPAISPGGPSLSDYQGAVVVDGGGNGDYTTVEAAIATEPSGTTIFGFGNIVENSFIAIGVDAGGLDKRFSIYIMPGAVWTIPDGMYISYDIAISCSGNGKVIVNTMPITAYDGIFELTDVRVEATGGGVKPVSLEPQTSLTAIISGCVLKPSSITTLALGTGGTIANFGANTRISHSTFLGRFGGSVWANAPIFHCDIAGTVATNTTVANGNYTNTLNGVTWPAIP